MKTSSNTKPKLTQVSSSKNSKPMARRSSLRQKNKNLAQSSSLEQSQFVDSAYDGDKDSPVSSPDQQDRNHYDPYKLDIEDDPPCVTKTNLKKKAKKVIKKGTLSTKTSVKNKKNVPTSTPVLRNCKVLVSKLQPSQEADSLSLTPEVTPILPCKPLETSSPSTDTFSTPQLHRPSRKRSLTASCMVDIPAQFSNSSYDSGIAVSPVSKKLRASDTEDSISQELHGFEKETESKIITREVHFTSGDENKNKRKKPPMSEIQVQDLITTENTKNTLDLCFGFDSLESPVLKSENSPPKKATKLNNAKRMNVDVDCAVKNSYRSELLDSSGSPLSLSVSNQDSTDYKSSESSPRMKSSSPTLFSDSFSAETGSMEEDAKVNKSTCKSYGRSVKRKFEKETKAATKLDMWASNFNMEIEDIEKFDLNIE